MIIDYLGHSEFLINIENADGKIVKIMSDAWLTNYAFGDLMARNPTFKLDYEKLGEIDAVFISHSHCDHFDPYTLIEMQKNFKNLPTLLIPETIRFLVPLIQKYLPNFPYKILKNKEEISIKGVKVKGLIFENDYVTNEDDVMTLFVYNDKEIVYAEVDTLPPEVDEAHNYIYDMFSSKKYDTVLYMATRNELEGNIKLLDIEDINKRKKFTSEYIKTRKEEIEWNLAKFDEGMVEYMEISKAKNFCKAFIGQGIGYPAKLDIEASKVHILGLDEVISIEKSTNQKYGRNYPITHFEAGQSYEIKNAKFNKIGKINYLKDFIFVKESSNLETKFKRYYLNGPLNDEKRDDKKQEEIILDLLNNRFLPYQISNLEDSMKNILITKKSDYIVKIIYGFNGDYTEKYYSYGFGSMKFEEISFSLNFDEDYYANDLEDFYNGKQELYSNFWHKLNPKCAYRLWTCLGSNFLNNDLVYKKYEFHFLKAIEGKLVDNFVEEVYKKFI
nr:MBL fold metallo-hydrolase [Candidatus Gracilibacteria bacterium]